MRWVALALVIACTPAIPPLPSRGGPKWVELQTDHFTMWTDDAPDHARKLVRSMEKLQQIVYGIAFPDARATTRTFVIAFRNTKELHAYVAEGFGAQAFPLPNAFDQPAIVVPADAVERRPDMLTHELAHVISFNVLPQQTHWFAEGLATYFESIRLDDFTGTLDVGVPPRGRLMGARQRALPVAELFACNRMSCLDGTYYATAWAFFAFLVSAHPRELVAYMQRIAATPLAQQNALWSQMFPQLAPEVVDLELRAWIAHGRSSVKRFTIEERDVAIAERELADADVHAARGITRYLTHRRETVVSPEIAAALAADPTHVRARVIEHSLGGKLTPELAQKVAAAHADDWRAWWLAWRAGDSEALGRMCETIARDPPVDVDKLCPPPPIPAPTPEI
jgi:hypothetical protein